MTPAEQKMAFEEYEKFRKRYAYKRKYRDLKNAKPLMYFFSYGSLGKSAIGDLAKRMRKGEPSAVVTQTLGDLHGSEK